MYLPGTCTHRVGIYFRAGLVIFVRFQLGSDRNKPHRETVDLCSVRLGRAEGGVMHFLGARDSVVSAILCNR